MTAGKDFIFMKTKKIFVLAMLLTFCALMMTPVRAEAAAARLNKSKVVLEMDTQFKLKVKNASGKVKWYTSDKKVVKVKKGLLTPVSVGSAKVTARVNGRYLTCTVAVVDYSDMTVEQQEVVSYALQYLGNRYVYGGSSLTNGTDCSGFTMSVYKNFGYELTHNAYMQMKEIKSVKMSNIQPGDLIFYGSSKSSCSHVALYIGKGKVVHASTASTGIVISNYNYRKYVAVGRVLKTETYKEETPTIGDPEVAYLPEDIVNGQNETEAAKQQAEAAAQQADTAGQAVKQTNPDAQQKQEAKQAGSQEEAVTSGMRYQSMEEAIISGRY